LNDHHRVAGCGPPSSVQRLQGKARRVGRSRASQKEHISRPLADACEISSAESPAREMQIALSSFRPPTILLAPARISASTRLPSASPPARCSTRAYSPISWLMELVSRSLAVTANTKSWAPSAEALSANRAWCRLLRAGCVLRLALVGTRTTAAAWLGS
jgi:hypothetical protein